MFMRHAPKPKMTQEPENTQMEKDRLANAYIKEVKKNIYQTT